MPSEDGIVRRDEGTGYEEYIRQRNTREDEFEPKEDRASLLPFILAQAAMAGLGAAGTFFKGPGVIKTAEKVETFMDKNPGLKRVLNKILPIYEGAEKIVRRSGVSKADMQKVFSGRRTAMARDLENLVDIVKSKSPYSGAQDKLFGSAIEGMVQFAPTNIGPYRQFSLHDVVYGPTNPALEKLLGSDITSIRYLYRRAAASRPGAAYFAKAGLSPQIASRRIALSQGLFQHRKLGHVVDAGRFMPKNITTWMSRFKIPFVDWKPLELLLPTELMYSQPNIAPLTGEYAEVAMKQKLKRATQGLYSFGKVFPVIKTEGGALEIKAPLEGKYKLGHRASGMFRGASARLGITPGFGSLERYLANRGFISEETMKAAEAARNAGRPYNINQFMSKANKALSWTDKAVAYSASWGEKLGLGPQYSRRGRSKVSLVFDRLRDIVFNKPVITSEFKSKAVRPVASKHFIQDKIRKFFGLVKQKAVEYPRSVNELTAVERAMLKVGIEPKRTVTKPDSYYQERIKVARYGPEGISGKAKESAARFGEYYFYKDKNSGVADWFHYQVIRPFWLLEDITGIGFKPGKTALGSLGGILSRVALPAALAASALKYSDYKLGRFGLPGPITGASRLYVEARMFEQKVLDSLGITDAVKDLEDKYPGIVTSPASKAVRFGASVLGGALLGGAGLGMPAMIGGMLFGAMNLTDLTQSSTELNEIYSGKRDIPVYKGRWWATGRSPFSQGRIEYYRKHWYPAMMASYKDKALYGSKKEAWAHGSWLPTPENLFNIKKLFDPYYLERTHYKDRPYPLTATLGQDIPIVGPLAGVSPLRLMKPQYRMHPEFWSDTGNVASGIGPSEVENAGWQLGYNYWPRFQRRSVMRSRLDQMVGEQIYNISQWTGLTGFSLGLLKNQVTGSENWFDKRPQVAEAGAMASVQRGYYDRDLGGLLGTSEFFRRFVPRGRTYIEKFNPIPNTMPPWLPGRGSMFENDRESFVDFSTGDPFSKIKMGELRLPGIGYEAANMLHSGVPGKYDALDRLMVLADVAPQSDAFTHYRTIVDSWRKAGMLSGYWEDRYQIKMDQIDKINESQFEQRRYDPSLLRDHSVTIGDVLSPTRFRANDGKIYQLAGVEDDFDRAKWRARSEGKDSEDLSGRYTMLRNELEKLQGQSVDIRIGGQGMENTIPAIVPGINERALKWGISKPTVTAADAQAKYGTSIVTSLWDSVRHARIPGPLGWPVTKALARRDAIEEYQLAELEGGDFAGWQSPYKNFVRFWGRQTLNTFTGTPMIPKEVERRRQVEEYFDRLKYYKYSRLSKFSREQDQVGVADTFGRMAQKTMTGIALGDGDITRDIWSAMPKSEKKYFRDFSREISPDRQHKILKMVPEYMQPIYLGVWSRGTQQFSPGIQAAMGDQTDVEIMGAQACKFFASHRLPDPGWAGWDPAVDIEQSRIRTVDRVAEDFHNYQVWEGQVRDAQGRGIPGVDPSLIFNSEAGNIDWMMMGDSQRNVRTASIASMGHTTSIGAMRDKRKKKQLYDSRVA